MPPFHRSRCAAPMATHSSSLRYALFTNGSLACAARCLAWSAFRRQVSLSDDIRGGSSNAPNQPASAALLWQRKSPPLRRGFFAARALMKCASTRRCRNNVSTPTSEKKSLARRCREARLYLSRRFRGLACSRRQQHMCARHKTSVDSDFQDTNRYAVQHYSNKRTRNRGMEQTEWP
jgi:hypothetical protein